MKKMFRNQLIINMPLWLRQIHNQVHNGLEIVDANCPTLKIKWRIVRENQMENTGVQ